MRENELPSGFEYVFDDTFGGRRRIVVPTKIKEMMEAEYRERVRISDELDKAKAQAEFSDPDFKTFDHQPASTRHSKSRDSAKAAWYEIELADSEYSCDKRRFSVFKASAATPLANATGDESEVNRLQDIYDELTKRETTLRLVARVPSLEPLRQSCCMARCLSSMESGLPVWVVISWGACGGRIRPRNRHFATRRRQ